ncbi:MAG: TIGR04002 family protein [Clostridia bacterium]|nr:TIGR04002 family protein [Clostridia bacterium]
MKRNKQQQTLKYSVLASVFATIITVLTFYIKIPSHNGYIHLGDSVIYLAAALLPAPFAMVCAGLGGMLADALGGYTLYILPTFIIKMLIALPFSSKRDRVITNRNIIALPIASAITILGYYIAEAVLVSLSATGSPEQFFSYLFSPAPWVATLYAIPGSVMQAVGSAVMFVLLGFALDKIKIKSKI